MSKKPNKIFKRMYYELAESLFKDMIKQLNNEGEFTKATKTVTYDNDKGSKLKFRLTFEWVEE